MKLLLFHKGRKTVMILRKVLVAILTSFFVILFGSTYISSWDMFQTFYEAWFFVSLFAVTGILFYLLPVSVLAEFISRKYTNSIVRGGISLAIHIALVALFGLWDANLGYIAVFAAFGFFVIDELTRNFYDIPLMKKLIVFSTIATGLITVCLMIIGFMSTPTS
ncbi:hypothetical protein [Alkalihalophilus marmarensis]|uniref:hypothetical protein n=1 Tax=Alkalihalophilus marmarensis TaxID=521377 RepID=UPI002DB6AE7D|nr:hypothetical protein [Alkalihalophilus marmarensis]MEC2071099.1 hypothetical protein [Alkalihalophilus marmarensis]